MQQIVKHMYDRPESGLRIAEPGYYVHGPKILWWKHEHPDIYKRTAKFIPPNAYVVGKMTGLSGYEAYFDYTHLHFSCLADNSNKSWSDELLEIFDIDKQKMARIVSPFDVIGKVTKDFAGLSGLMEGIPVVAGCGDTAASTFGSGMFQREQVLIVQELLPYYAALLINMFLIQNETLTMMRSPGWLVSASCIY